MPKSRHQEHLEYYTKNKARCIEAVRKWQKENKDYYNLKQRENYAKRKSSAVGSAVTSAVDVINMKVVHGKFTLVF